MLTNIPLMVVPLIIYNLVLFGIFGTADSVFWSGEVMKLWMISGAEWTMTVGDLIIALGLIMLFVEILKATRVGVNSIIDHLLSTGVFVIFLVEFLVVAGAATSVFFLLMLMTLIDVLAGFSVSIRSATRDVSLGGGSF